jgi:hypothetical protein
MDVVTIDRFLDSPTTPVILSIVSDVLTYYGDDFREWCVRDQRLLDSKEVTAKDLADSFAAPMSTHTKKITIDDLADLTYHLLTNRVHFKDYPKAVGYLTHKHQFLNKESMVKGFTMTVASGDADDLDKFTEIVVELRKYGDLKQFYSHAQYVELCWDVLMTFLRQFPTFDRFRSVLAEGLFVGDEEWFLITKEEAQVVRQHLFNTLGGASDTFVGDLLAININKFEENDFERFRDVAIFGCALHKFVG